MLRFFHPSLFVSVIVGLGMSQDPCAIGMHPRRTHHQLYRCAFMSGTTLRCGQGNQLEVLSGYHWVPLCLVEPPRHPAMDVCRRGDCPEHSGKGHDTEPLLLRDHRHCQPSLAHAMSAVAMPTVHRAGAPTSVFILNYSISHLGPPGVMLAPISFKLCKRHWHDEVRVWRSRVLVEKRRPSVGRFGDCIFFPSYGVVPPKTGASGLTQRRRIAI